MKTMPTTYAPLLAGLKARVRVAQVKAAVALNRELMLLYWHIGREAGARKSSSGWRRIWRRSSRRWVGSLTLT